MDKLRLAFKLITKAAKQKRDAGEIPSFLGATGMLALMYDSIINYTKVPDDEDEQTRYLMDLAVRSINAFATILPDMDEEEIDDEIVDDNDNPPFETEEPRQEEEDDSDDPRWTPVKPGQPLPGVSKDEG